MTKTNDYFMQSALIEEAWEELSESFPWTETMLEKHQNEVNWKKISSNRIITWTVPMVQKFAEKLDWTEFSRVVEKFPTAKNIEIFKDYWDWHSLSMNINLKLTDELIERYVGYWDWGEIIDSMQYRGLVFLDRGIEFYNKFKEYIPTSKLQDSNLWTEMVKEQKGKIINEIIS